jgi:hypothetical protein
MKQVKQVKQCAVCNSTTKVSNSVIGLLCNKHYSQYVRYGAVRTRTSYDLNEIIIKDDFAEIVLYDKKCNEKGRTTIDLDNVDKVKDIRWTSTTDNYVVSYNGGNPIYLHRFILDCPIDKIIDHINHDTLNNRRCNLRVVSNAENLQNRKGVQSNNTSNILGVSFCTSRNKWQVDIQVFNKRIFGGYFNTKEEAAIKRKELEIKHYNNEINKSKV